MLRGGDEGVAGEQGFAVALGGGGEGNGEIGEVAQRRSIIGVVGVGEEDGVGTDAAVGERAGYPGLDGGCGADPAIGDGRFEVFRSRYGAHRESRRQPGQQLLQRRRVGHLRLSSAWSSLPCA